MLAYAKEYCSYVPTFHCGDSNVDEYKVCNFVSTIRNINSHATLWCRQNGETIATIRGLMEVYNNKFYAFVGL